MAFSSTAHPNGPIVLSIYFSGTGFAVGSPDQENQTDRDTISSALFRCSKHSRRDNQFSHGFWGCGLSEVGGFLGGIYGAGISGQVRSVKNLVHKLHSDYPGKKITLNMYGHSRGGITATLAAKALGITNFPLDINMALLDPVPGNFDITQALDPADCTLANQAMDLSGCKNLKNVLRLLPYDGAIAMPLMAHTPLISIFPKECNVVDEVIAGRHADTEKLKYAVLKGKTEEINNKGKRKKVSLYDYDYHPFSIAALDLVTRFMEKYGTQYEPDAEWAKIRRLKLRDDELLKFYNEMATRITASSKSTHSKESATIVAVPGAPWVNEHHKEVYLRENPTADRVLISQEPVILALEKGSLLERLKRVNLRRILVATLKWLVIAAAVATTLYFTGGLAAIPYLAPLVAKMGLWAIPAATGVMTPLIKLVSKNWESLVKGAALAALIYFTGGLAAIPFIAPVVAQLGVWSIALLAPVMAPVAKLSIEIYNHTLKPVVRWLGGKISDGVMRKKEDNQGYTGEDIMWDKKPHKFSPFLSTKAQLAKKIGFQENKATPEQVTTSLAYGDRAGLGFNHTEKATEDEDLGYSSDSSSDDETTAHLFPTSPKNGRTWV